MTLRRASLVDDDLVGIDLDALSRDVLTVDLARSVFHLADARAIVVRELPATNVHARHARRHLHDVRLILDDDVLRKSVSLDLVGKHAAVVDLRDFDAASREELARHLVIKQLVALESRRQRFQVIFHRLTQMRLHCRRIFDELLLRFCQAIFPRRTPLVLNVVENIRRRIGRCAVRCRRRGRQTGGREECGTGDAPGERNAPLHNLHETVSHLSVVGTA